jgi:hypothetical protein
MNCSPLLRQQLGDRLRFNIYNQAVELDGTASHRYLEHLLPPACACSASRSAKELAADALDLRSSRRTSSILSVTTSIAYAEEVPAMRRLITLATAYLRPHRPARHPVRRHAALHSDCSSAPHL